MSFIAPSGSIAPNAWYPLMAACLLTVASMPNLTWSPSTFDARSGPRTPQDTDGSSWRGEGAVVGDARVGQATEQLAGVRDEGDPGIGEHRGQLAERHPPTLRNLLGLVPDRAVPDGLEGVLEAARALALVEVRDQPPQRHAGDPELLAELAHRRLLGPLPHGDHATGRGVPVSRSPVLRVAA